MSQWDCKYCGNLFPKDEEGHLINIPSNPVLNGRCPQSVCSFCLFYDGQLFEFNNRSSYNYHRKKCPHKKKDLKRFIKNYDYECKLVDEQEDIIFFKEQEEDKKMMELKKEKEALEEKRRILNPEHHSMIHPHQDPKHQLIERKITKKQKKK